MKHKKQKKHKQQKTKPLKIQQERSVWEDVILTSMLRVYLLCIIMELGKLLMYEPTPSYTFREYAVYYFLFPILWEGCLFLVLKLAVVWGKERWNKLVLDILCIIVTNVYAVIIAFMHAKVSFVGMVYAIPLALAAVYRKKQLIHLQLGITVLLFIWSRIWMLPQLSYLPNESMIKDIVVYTAMAAVFAIIEEQVRQSYIRHDVRAHKDSLTRLYNHEAFYQELERNMKQFEENHEPFSILVADIDNFKRVNDTYGHAFGDEVIRLVADVMKNNHGSKGFTARYGGEEFAMIMPQKKVADAILLADKIRRKFAEQKLETIDGEKSFTISIGVAEYNKSYRTSSAFFEEADKALYEAKKSGKNKVCCNK